MAESIIAYGIAAAGVWYGLYRFVIAIAEAEEARHRAGELAWQERSR